MFRSKLIIVFMCAMALGAGILACGSSSSDPVPCYITATNDMFVGTWLISPGSLDEVASYVSFDGMGNITAHGFMYDPDFGIVTPTGCGNFSMTIQNSTAEEMVIKGTLANGDAGTITSIGGMATSAAFTHMSGAPLHGSRVYGTFTETCSSSSYPELCNGMTYDYNITDIFSEDPTGTVTGNGETFVVNTADSIAMWADNNYFFFLATDAKIVNSALESYGMIRFSVDDSTTIGKYHLDSDVDGPVGTGSINFY